jgi:hypothetical protein
MQRIIVRLAALAAVAALAAIPTAALAKQGGDDPPGHGQGDGHANGQGHGNGNSQANGNGNGRGSGDDGTSHGQPPASGGSDDQGDTPAPSSGQSPNAEHSPPASGGDGSTHGGGPPADSPGASHGRKVTLSFQGSVTAIDATAETASVKVKKGNRASRRFVGDTVDLDVSDTRVEVDDVSGDGAAGLADVSTGDRVLVHVRVPPAMITATPLPASLLVDLTAPPPEDEGDGA